MHEFIDLLLFFIQEQIILNLLNKCGNPAIIGPYLTAFSYKSHKGTAIILTFLGTAKTSTRRERVSEWKGDGLDLRLGGNLTRNKAILSLGRVT